MSARAFHDLHAAAQPLVLPNAWDYVSAALLVDAGFAAIGTTSLGVAAARGLPDGHGITRQATLELGHLLASLPCLVSVDIEGGFSDDPGQVADLVEELASSGVVGVNIEDGRADGTLADPTRQSGLIAAVKTRVPDLFVNARVDNYWLSVEADVGATLARARRYVDAGADGVFVPGRLDAATVEALVAGTAVPLNVLYLPDGLGTGELAGLGVRRISTGSLLFRTAVAAAVRAARTVRDGGTPSERAPGYADIQRLCDRKVC
ncbi:2-methylisocitrate lyase-like PEP mutase family enzyme [Saccharomonospora amisosensis]|uniref:2-methylisocitrate lyase-like PEP mutase family enzyme n=1 Tax=Saccharomonospora amisosensis TaxID=1128677 RepID=A0A7X5UMC0_9PSEU|nr:isocitrate lyase/phosphoenolpyruvate mutase family protein [Saccharomonospora amisosensis]NIJ10327.1 2-methylisocitrate lyase-like PEP mutase family enzyme [Saccharomonospora amisosensis]